MASSSTTHDGAVTRCADEADDDDDDDDLSECGRDEGAYRRGDVDGERDAAVDVDDDDEDDDDEAADDDGGE